MRRRAALLALAGLLLTLAGCGVAGETRITRDHDAARRGLESGDRDLAVPRTREQSTSPEQAVANYLRAVAGDREHAVDRVRDFLLPEARGTFNPPAEVVVVRQLNDLVPSLRGGNSYEVPVRLQPVGVLTEQGAIRPLASDQRAVIEYTFVVSPGEAVQQPGYYLSKPYERLLLSTSALAPVTSGPADQDTNVLYRAHVLYFWDTQLRTLVPDLRYLPRSTPAAQRPTEVVRRLLTGPSDWLGSTVQPPPPGADMRGSVVVKGGRMVVDLNAKATPPGGISPEKLLAQLRWSLWDWHQGSITLQIEGQEKASDGSPSAYISDNPAFELTSDPDMFCIADGVVLAECVDPARSGAPVILRSPFNRDVRSAAISRRGNSWYAALVQAVGTRRALVVGHAGPGDTDPAYVQSGLTARAMSRPVWLGRGETRIAGLVAADGQLYVFDASGRTTVLPTGVTGIQTVAVAPDARRIAFIANNEVYVASLSPQRDRFAVGVPQRLPTTVSGLTGVGFSRPDRLVVAGTRFLAELSVDGAIEDRFHDLGDVKVTGISVHPDNPENGPTRGEILVEIGDTARQVYASRTLQIIWQGPAPTSPPPGGKPPTPPRVTAAFFEG